MLDIAGRTAAARQRSPLRLPGRRTLIRAGVIAVLFLFVLLALPQLLSLYYIDAMTQVVVYSVVTLGLGVLVGRVGLVSLGQVAVLAIGAWVAARLLFATTQPYPLVLLEAGVITMVLGTLIGLPGAAAARAVPGADHADAGRRDHRRADHTNFPNGGRGFLGYNGAAVHIPAIRRPAIAETDPAYYRYAVVVAALMFLLVARAHPDQARPGLGGDPAERARRAGRGDQHHAVQAVGVRARLVHHRRGRRRAGAAPSTTCTRSASRPRTRSRCWPWC